MERISLIINECHSCELAKFRKKIVTGAGNLSASLVLVGEAPGRKEDESGLPFVGSAGKILDEILESSGLSRSEIYITNILKCRPPRNRRPKKTEISLCEEYLVKQLELIRPLIIAPMGNSSLSYFQNMFELEKANIGDTHGKVFEVKASWGNVKLIPLYHPAAAIYRKQLLDELLADMRLVVTLLKEDFKK
jgi:DNA polymerase